jgi:hypothetical protein
VAEESVAEESVAQRLLARSPVQPLPPVGVVSGWEVSLARSAAALTLADWTPLGKFLTYGTGGPAFGTAVRDGAALAVGWAPGQTLLLAPAGSEAPAGAVDLTSALVLFRLTGAHIHSLWAKLCAVDLHVAADGAVFRSSVAKVAATLVRDDRPGGMSYLVACDRSYGAYLWEAVLDAGAEFGIEPTGFDGGR